MAEKKSRVIRIEIPAELELREDQINALEFDFRSRLVDVESGSVLDVDPSESINSTKFAVQVDVTPSAPQRARKARKTPKK